MNIDPNVVLAVVAVIAFLSPPLTAQINNSHQIKMKKLEMYEFAKRDALNDFITSAEQFSTGKFYTESFVKFNASINKLYIFFDIHDTSMFDKLKECIDNEDDQKIQYLISEIVKYLSKQIAKK